MISVIKTNIQLHPIDYVSIEYSAPKGIGGVTGSFYDSLTKGVNTSVFSWLS